MRKITSILAIFCLFTVFLVSCSKSESSEKATTSSNSLVGTWAIKSANGQEITDDCDKKTSLVFSSTNFTMSVYANDGSKCISETGSFSYTISGDKIILKKANGETATNSIIILNETTFSYKTEDDNIFVFTKK